MASRGRPTKLKPELTDELCKLLSEGRPLKSSCKRVGIDDSTFRKWRRQLIEGDEGKREFFTRVARAQAEGQLHLLDIALSGDERGVSNGPAKCAQWALERIFPNEFAPRLNVKLEEGLELLLDHVERVCEGKDCGCYESIISAISADEAGFSEAERYPGEPQRELH